MTCRSAFDPKVIGLWVIQLVIFLSQPVSAGYLAKEFYYQRIEEFVAKKPGNAYSESGSASPISFKKDKNGVENGIPFQTLYIPKKLEDGSIEGYYKVRRFQITSLDNLSKVIGEANSSQEDIKTFFSYLFSREWNSYQNLWQRTGEYEEGPCQIVYTDAERDQNGYDFEEVKKDLYQNCAGSVIRLNTLDMEGRSEAAIKDTFAHEFGHFLDPRSNRSYGLDGVHFQNERTDPHTAFLEGWAEFMALRRQVVENQVDPGFSPETFKTLLFGNGKKNGKFVVESDSEKGKYSSMSSLGAGQELLSVEGVIALLLFQIWSELGTGGDDVVLGTFRKLRDDDGFKEMLLELKKRMPKDGFENAVDQASNGILDANSLIEWCEGVTGESGSPGTVSAEPEREPQQMKGSEAPGEGLW